MSINCVIFVLRNRIYKLNANYKKTDLIIYFTESNYRFRNFRNLFDVKRE